MIDNLAPEARALPLFCTCTNVATRWCVTFWARETFQRASREAGLVGWPSYDRSPPRNDPDLVALAVCASQLSTPRRATRQFGAASAKERSACPRHSARSCLRQYSAWHTQKLIDVPTHQDVCLLSITKRSTRFCRTTTRARPPQHLAHDGAAACLHRLLDVHRLLRPQPPPRVSDKGRDTGSRALYTISTRSEQA